MTSFFRISPAFTLFSVVFLGCGGGDLPPVDDGGLATHPRFELVEGDLDFGAIPFPDDLYRDASGGIALARLPREELGEPGTVASLRESLRELDGFGVVSPVYVFFDGAIDPSSLPDAPSATLVEDASVFLVDADPASPDAFGRVPVVVRWIAEEQRLSLQPMNGHPLVEGRRYAAVVTTRVLAANGAPIAPSERYAAIRDASARPTEPLAARAYDGHAPVLASLAANGVPRAEIAALAVFTVQTVGRTLTRAREDLRAAELPTIALERVVGAGAELDALLGTPTEPVVGGDAPGGVLHEHIGWVIDGTFSTRELASPSPGVHGAWQVGEDGHPVVRRADTAWFTLVLPAGADLSSVPVVIYQHGLGGQRGDVFSIADTLCAAGFAVAALDIPYHGMRASFAIDRRHQYGATEGSDLYGDGGGDTVYLDYLGVVDGAGELVSFHPFYTRDVLRQSVIDLMTLARVLDEADLSTGVATLGGPAFAIADGPIGFVGISLGGILGTVFVANEPTVGAAVLSVTGGYLARLVENSGSFGTRFLGILLPRLGTEYADVDWATEPASARPEVAIFQTLLDRGDSMSHARVLSARGVHVLMHMAEHDETVPNVATESLAAAIGMPMIGAAPVYTAIEPGTLPLTGNVMVGSERYTRGLVTWSPATHGMLGWRGGDSRWEPPVTPPFVAREEPIAIENPIDDAQLQMRRFFATWREGVPEIADPNPPI